jgi:phage pi2 protein 07
LQLGGDIIILQQQTDEKTKLMLEKKRTESVRDEDIRWWWNMHDLERRMMLKVDDLTRGAMFINSLDKGMRDDEAAATVRRYHPMYGNPDDTSNSNLHSR